MKDKVVVQVRSLEETKALGRFIADFVQPAWLFAVEGSLGAGKTAFAQAIAEGLEIKENVSSPTFTILKCYFSGKVPFYHIDAYRFEDHMNMDIGLEEVIDGDGFAYVEWAQFIPHLLQQECSVQIEVKDDGVRFFTFSSETQKYDACLRALKEFNKK